MVPKNEESLLQAIRELKRSEVKHVIDRRLHQFKDLGNKTSGEIFKELCFCILCANYTAERGIKVQTEIGDEFLTLDESNLAKKLKEVGYRFPNVRAKFIVEARRFKDSLKETLASFDDENILRDWLIRNVKGIGPKEASHFLRNIGYTNYAILDFHIIDVLVKHRLIEKPKTLTKRKYLEVEDLLKEISRKIELNLAELDLYMWYMETGKILK